jgi:hypothetical protein
MEPSSPSCRPPSVGCRRRDAFAISRNTTMATPTFSYRCKWRGALGRGERGQRNLLDRCIPGRTRPRRVERREDRLRTADSTASASADAWRQRGAARTRPDRHHRVAEAPAPVGPRTTRWRARGDGQAYDQRTDELVMVDLENRSARGGEVGSLVGGRGVRINGRIAITAR